MANLRAIGITGAAGLVAAFAGVVGGQDSARVERAEHRNPLIILRVLETASSRAVSHPVVCIREVDEGHGAIGDSAGWAAFGGNLPKGTLHLRVVAPRHHATDTVVTWPPAANAKPLTILLRPRAGAEVEPRC
jgi:hypothetical protein